MAREVSVEMSKVLGFATDWFKSNVRVILQYSVKKPQIIFFRNSALHCITFQ